MPALLIEHVDGAEALEGALHHARGGFLREVRSPGVTSASGPALRSPSSERAVSESLAPQRANSAAQAAPMPSEAPVMSTTLPSSRMRMASY